MHPITVKWVSADGTHCCLPLSSVIATHTSTDRTASVAAVTAVKSLHDGAAVGPAELPAAPSVARGTQHKRQQSLFKLNLPMWPPPARKVAPNSAINIHQVDVGLLFETDTTSVRRKFSSNLKRLPTSMRWKSVSNLKWKPTSEFSKLWKSASNPNRTPTCTGGMDK